MSAPPERYDSMEDSQAEEDLQADLEEVADATKQRITGDSEPEVVMRNYVLNHMKDEGVSIDFTKDSDIMKVLKLQIQELHATYTYVRAQVRDNSDSGLTKAIVDNMANIVWKIDHDQKTHDEVCQDKELRSAVKRFIGNFLFIPDWLQIAVNLGAHIGNAFQNRASGRSKRQGGSLSNASI